MIGLYAVHYPDKDAAKLIYRELYKLREELGIVSMALETYLTRSKRAKSRLKIIVALEKELGQNLPSILKCAEKSLYQHPLYGYLSFDNTVRPLSHIKWNFDSYDDENYQKVFIKRRTKG